jgi:hypothetical protein
MTDEEYDILLQFLQREVDYYLRIVTVLTDEVSEYEIVFIRDDVDSEYPTDEAFVDVLQRVLVDPNTNYNIKRAADSLIYQFEDGEDRHVIVSLDPEVTEYNDVIALGDQCQKYIPGVEFEFSPRHPLPNESEPLPDRS